MFRVQALACVGSPSSNLKVWTVNSAITELSFGLIRSRRFRRSLTSGPRRRRYQGLIRAASVEPSRAHAASESLRLMNSNVGHEHYRRQIIRDSSHSFARIAPMKWNSDLMKQAPVDL